MIKLWRFKPERGHNSIVIDNVPNFQSMLRPRLEIAKFNCDCNKTMSFVYYFIENGLIFTKYFQLIYQQFK